MGKAFKNIIRGKEAELVNYCKKHGAYEIEQWVEKKTGYHVNYYSTILNWRNDQKIKPSQLNQSTEEEKVFLNMALYEDGLPLLIPKNWSVTDYLHARNTLHNNENDIKHIIYQAEQIKKEAGILMRRIHKVIKSLESL